MTINTKTSLDVRKVLVAAICYYSFDQPIMTDDEFDRRCEALADDWDVLTTYEQRLLGSPEKLRASGFHILAPRAAVAAACHLLGPPAPTPNVMHGPDWKTLGRFGLDVISVAAVRAGGRDMQSRIDDDV